MLQTLRSRMWPVWLFVVGIAAALLGMLLYGFLYPAPTPLTQNEIDDTVAQAMASATPPPAYSTQVYQAILPSLVFIKTERETLEEEREDEKLEF